MSTSQEIIDFMNGNKKSKNKTTSSSSKSQRTKLTKATTNDVSISEDTTTGKHVPTLLNVDDANTPTSNYIYTSPSSNNSNRDNTTYSKVYKLIQKSFIDVMNEWIDIDDQIYRIIKSITNLRERVYHTNQYLQKKQKTQQMMIFSSSTTTTASMLWKQYGYRHRQHYYTSDNDTDSNTKITNSDKISTIHEDDLQTTLDHNIQHQERMIGELRRFLPSLRSIVDKMGRRYEELYMQGQQSYTTFNNINNNGTSISMLSIDDCLLLYIAFAKDLFRKQMIAQRILDTCSSDQLLLLNKDINIYNRNHQSPNSNDDNPIRIAHKCLKQWSYMSKDSYLFPHVQLIQELIKISNT
jgi:hypothetical protein